MNKIIFLTILIFICINIFPDAIEESDNNIKRTILILPFQNKNNVSEYNYLSDVLMETLRIELEEQNLYNFTDYTESTQIIKDIKKNNIDVMDIEISRKIAIDLFADVLIIGQYIVSENNLMIIIQAIDIINGDLVAITKIQGELGVNIFNLISASSKDMSDKIVKKLKSVTDEEYNNLFKKLKNDKRLFFINMPVYKKAGLVLTITGGSLLLISIPVIIYDFAGYSRIMLSNKQYYLDTGKNYEAYQNSYIIFLSLFCISLTGIGIGAVLLITGLPLMLVNKKQKTIAFKCELYNNEIIVALKYKFH